MSEFEIFRPCEADLNDIVSSSAPYAMAFVRPQRWETPLSARSALERGTAFARLVKPFGAMEVFR